MINRDHSSIIHLCNERPLPDDSIVKLQIVREGSEIMDRVSSLAFTIYKNPNDEDARRKLKNLL